MIQAMGRDVRELNQADRDSDFTDCRSDRGGMFETAALEWIYRV